MASNQPPRRVQRRFLLVLALSLPLLASCTREPPVEKTLLARLPVDYKPNSMVISEDGHSYAFVRISPEGERVVTPHGTSAPHTQCTRLTFAPKTQRLFYWTLDETADQRLFSLVAEGTTIPTDFVGPGGLAFSDDGSRWAGIGVGPSNVEGEVGDFTLYIDGENVGSHQDAGMPAFSPDGKHTAYVIARDKQVTLLIDGVAQHIFDPPTAPCGAAAAQTARRPDLPLHHMVRYLADGSLFVITRDADGWGVYRDGARLASYALSRSDSVTEDCRTGAVIAPASLRKAERAPVAYWWERVAGEADLWRVSRDGQPLDDVICSEPWKRQPPEVSADGTHVAYACALRDADNLTTAFLIKDGRRHGPYAEIWGIALSKDGTHVTYGATLPGGPPVPRPWAIYVDGEARVRDFASVWRPRISDDGKTLAWQAKHTEDGRGFLGIADRYVGTFDDVLWGPEFETDERAVVRVAWIIRRGRKITRLTVPLTVVDQPRRPTTVVHRDA